MIKEKLAKIKSGKLTAKKNIENFLKLIKENKKINAFIYINKDALKQAGIVDKKIKQGKAGRLAGLAIAVKSNINVIDMPITCASKTLENYYGTFDSDIIRGSSQLGTTPRISMQDSENPFSRKGFSHCSFRTPLPTRTKRAVGMRLKTIGADASKTSMPIS